MDIGELTFNPNGTIAKKTGLAGALYDERLAAMAETGQDVAKVNKAVMGAFCRADARAIVNTMKATARAVVKAGGLQRTPNPNDPGVATVAPAAPVYLPIE